MSEQQRKTIFDVLEAQLDAIDAATKSARETLGLLRSQVRAQQQPPQRQRPRTFGDKQQQETTS